MLEEVVIVAVFVRLGEADGVEESLLVCVCVPLSYCVCVCEAVTLNVAVAV